MSDKNGRDAERLIPNASVDYGTFQEHIGRYVFASQFIKDKIVLDIASGAGYGSSYLCKRGAARVIGADISFEAICYAKNRYRRECLDFVLADATQMPFKDCSFEFLVSFETIEHVEKYETFLSECARVLTDDGSLICSTPNKEVFAYKPQNPYHVREFYAVEFFELVSKYFSEVHRFGQVKVPIWRLKAGKLLKRRDNPLTKKDLGISTPRESFETQLWILLRAGLSRLNSCRKKKPQKNVDLKRIIDQANFADVLLNDFKVTPFEDNLFVASGFFLALCKKPKKQNATD